MIYLDYAATTPIRREALDVYQEVAERYYGNASSLHDIGTKANEALALCRKQLADMVNGESEGVYFTSGGSEANILAVRSLLLGNLSKGNHIITTEIEHASLYNECKQLEKEGYDVTFLGVDEHGRVKIDELFNSLRDDTVLVSIQHANSETGVIQPIEEIGSLLQERDIIFHTDTVQTFGKIPIDIQKMGIDSLSIASHKLYGPKGVGACYIRPEVRFRSVHEGTTHEAGFRPGTVDVPGVVAFTTAANLHVAEAKDEQSRLHDLRTYFLKKLSRLMADIQLEANPHAQLPGIIGFTSQKVQGQHIMLECNRYGIAISTGSACQVGQSQPSRTMLAVGKEENIANGFFRISLGIHTTKEDLDTTVSILEKIIAEI